MDKMEQGPAQQIRRGCQDKVTWEVRNGGEAAGVALANQKNGHEAESQYFGLMEAGGVEEPTTRFGCGCWWLNVDVWCDQG